MNERITAGDFALWASLLISSVWGSNGFTINQISWIIIAIMIFIKTKNER